MRSKIDERAITRKFLTNMNESMIGMMPLGMQDSSCEDDDMHSIYSKEYSEAHSEEAHGALKTDQYGVVPKDELYSHFDLNSDGTVTPEEYAEHIDFHCAHPETLDHYRTHRSQSCETVPCQSSYDSVSQHFMGKPDSLMTFVQDTCDETGSTCHTSTMQGMFDVLKSLKDAGII